MSRSFAAGLIAKLRGTRRACVGAQEVGQLFESSETRKKKKKRRKFLLEDVKRPDLT